MDIFINYKYLTLYIFISFVTDSDYKDIQGTIETLHGIILAPNCSESFISKHY